MNGLGVQARFFAYQGNSLIESRWTQSTFSSFREDRKSDRCHRPEEFGTDDLDVLSILCNPQARRRVRAVSVGTRLPFFSMSPVARWLRRHRQDTGFDGFSS